MFNSSSRLRLDFWSFGLLSVLGLTIAFEVTCYHSTSRAIGQTKERVLKKGTFPNEPMKVIGIKVKGKAIDTDKKFVEDDDWIESLSVRLKNTSDKPVVFVELSLRFPAVEGRPNGPERIHTRHLLRPKSKWASR